MLTLRQIENDDYSKINNILKVYEIKDDLSKGIIYVLENKSDIMGVGKILLKNDYGILKYIVVNEDFRGSNFGDAILRGIFFKSHNMDINTIYYSYNNKYLLKKGFKHNKEHFLDKYKLYLNIDDFFNKSCCGDINGL
ncbi:hypothetical protein [Clostridium sp. Cult2]|uniref:hypothetical protein n=1 Tax=Clostridium sp. Cult2 TaxID=2079003 RepID=UPI001F2D7A4C|nr:hypothetical protein [Clostridium sp. Cult2]MCF6465115.1 hypothetical protein [Clostridium sp. Cult2]